MINEVNSTSNNNQTDSNTYNKNNLMNQIKDNNLSKVSIWNKLLNNLIFKKFICYKSICYIFYLNIFIFHKNLVIIQYSYYEITLLFGTFFN